MSTGMVPPNELAKIAISVSVKKCERTLSEMLILGFMAGAFVALAGQASSVAVHSLENLGLARMLTGVVFSFGLMMVLVAGGELFLGNTLIIMAVFEKKTTLRKMLKNWSLAYIANFLGAIVVALFVYQTHQYNYSLGAMGAYTINLAISKLSLTFLQAFFSGLLCAWIVVTGVWMSFSTTSLPGKCICAFIVITLFITSGFDNSIANMYYIPAGIITKSNTEYVSAVINNGVSQVAIDGLNWGNMIIKNLIPATLGNIVGGSGFVGFLYWAAYLRKKSSERRLERQRELEQKNKEAMELELKRQSRNKDFEF